jgi:hypothetical protein
MKKSHLFLFIFLFSLTLSYNFSILANDEIYQDIKSMRWKKIDRSIANKSRITQSEAYALVRYHEESSNSNPTYRVRLLYSILTGSMPKNVGEREAKELLNQSIPFEKAIIRLSYWKMYLALSQKKLLTIPEKILFLEKFPLEPDPIFLEAFEEQLKLFLDTSNYTLVIKRINEIKEEDKFTVYTDMVKYYHGIALYKTGEEQKSIELFNKLIEEDTNLILKKNIFRELKILLGSEYFIKLNPNELSYLLTILSKDEIKIVTQKGIIHPNLIINDVNVVKNITNYFLKISPKIAFMFLKNNFQVINTDHSYLANIAESLIQSKELTLAYSLQNEFLIKSEVALVYKNYSRIYDSWGEEEKKFQNRLKYLSLNPYDLVYQDLLIDFLAETSSNSVSYAPMKYWEKAMNDIPNVSVKGRLVYWYLRYLRYLGEADKLKEILADFYNYCPGSYYAAVISEEFKQELSALSHPSNYLSNRESLLKYISVKHNIDFVTILIKQNLSFAFSKAAIDLSSRLLIAYENVSTNSILSTSADYFKLGSHKEGMTLAEHYFKKNKIGEKEKYELLVGIGDLSKNYYLSLFYTRLLMKQNQIPDDPLLIPKELTNRLYPKPHRELVRKNSQKFGVEEEVVYAIMRQESFFRENAISPANARGLMQVMPSTGKYLASKLNVTNYSLHDPEVSIQFGAKFLADLMKQNDNKLTWASIAYNGGPGNLRKWKRNHFKGDFNHFLEELPNKESRDYCRIIQSNYTIYKTLRKMEK